MRTPRLTLQSLAAGLAGLALGASLTACGGSEPDAAVDPASAASSSTTTESSESTGTESPVVIDNGGQISPEVFVEKIRNGVENTQYAHLEFVTGSAGQAVQGEGDVDYTSTPPSMRLTLNVGGQEQNILLVDSVMYIGSPKAAGKYLAFDLNDPNNPLGSDFVDQLDPTSTLTTFTEAVTSVVSLGEEDVDGQTLDHYDITIDTSKVAAEQPAGMPAEVTASIWLDDRDHMVKTLIDLGPSSYEATLSDFDKVVEVTAPPADKVVSPPAS
jgi:LppX_LprAFG lipoprotein